MQDKFLSDKKAMLRGRRVDWLLHCLIFKVAAYYLHNQHRKHAEFSRNRILEIEAIGIVKRAAEIPDEAVQLSMDPAAEAVVQGSDDKAYTICNPGTADATCTCTSFLRGSVCKHIVKVSWRLPGSFTKQPVVLISGVVDSGYCVKRELACYGIPT